MKQDIAIIDSALITVAELDQLARNGYTGTVTQNTIIATRLIN